MTTEGATAAPPATARVVRRAPLAELPFWPLYLSREEAARYLGVSSDVFDAEVRAGVWPPGRPRGGRGGRLTWNRALLDATAESLDCVPNAVAPAPATGPAADPAAAAIDRRLAALRR